MNKQQRNNVLNANGIATGKYFSFELPEGLAPGSNITISFNESGMPVIVKPENDPVCKQIFANGYVKNTKVHRRYIMAQTFALLNYKGREGEGWTAGLRRYDYNYTIKMMIEEIRILGILQKSDFESFEERSNFFNRAVVVATLQDYERKLTESVMRGLQGGPTSMRVWVPRFGRMTPMEFHNRCCFPIEELIRKINNTVGVGGYRNYEEIANGLATWYRMNYISLDYKTEKCKAWVDAFKGAGAYYTLMNMLKFHNCRVADSYESGFYYQHLGRRVVSKFMTEANSIAYVKSYARSHHGYEIMGLLKNVIEDNHFDFNERMKQLGVVPNRQWSLCF